jgi:hypothetical protein
MLCGRRRETKFERKTCELETSESRSRGPAASLCLLCLSRDYLWREMRGCKAVVGAKEWQLVRLPDAKGERSCVETMEARRTVQRTVPTTGERPSIYGWPWWTK